MNNPYIGLRYDELQKIQFMLMETLSMMTRIYYNVVFSGCHDMSAFHQTVEMLRKQYDQIHDAMDEHNIPTIKGKIDFPEDSPYGF